MSTVTYKWEKFLGLESTAPSVPGGFQLNPLHLALSLLQNRSSVSDFASGSEPLVEHATHVFCESVLDSLTSLPPEQSHCTFTLDVLVAFH